MYMQEQVERGMALLDEKKPDWRDTFDPRTLDMYYGSSCVLGQQYDGHWYSGLVELGLTFERAEEYGFRCSDEGNVEQSIREYAELGETWKALVNPPTAEHTYIHTHASRLA